MSANPESPEAFNLQASLAETYDGLVTKIFQSLPELLGAIVLLIVGWLVASGVKIAVRKMITGLDALLHPMLGGEGGRTSTLRFTYAAIIGRVAFWSVMLFFIAAATNLVGWSLFTDWTQNVVQFVPQLVTGLLIILAGVLLGSGIKTIVTRTAASAKLQKPELIGRISQLAVIFTMGVIGVEQLGINVHFLTESLIVFVGVFLAGGALAFSLFDENISLISNEPITDPPPREPASTDAKEERAS